MQIFYLLDLNKKYIKLKTEIFLCYFEKELLNLKAF